MCNKRRSNSELCCRLLSLAWKDLRQVPCPTRVLLLVAFSMIVPLFNQILDSWKNIFIVFQKSKCCHNPFRWGVRACFYRFVLHWRHGECICTLLLQPATHAQYKCTVSGVQAQRTALTVCGSDSESWNKSGLEYVFHSRTLSFIAGLGFLWYSTESSFQFSSEVLLV